MWKLISEWLIPFIPFSQWNFFISNDHMEKITWDTNNILTFIPLLRMKFIPQAFFNSCLTKICFEKYMQREVKDA